MTVATDRRLVTFNSEAFFLPCGIEQLHIGEIIFNHSKINAGTFKLRINGQETVAVAYNSTIATMVTDVADAVNTIFPNTFTVAANGNNIRLSSRINEFYRIELLQSLSSKFKYSLIIVGTPLNGVFKLKVNGSSTSDITISNSLAGSTIATKINALSGISNVAVSGNISKGYTITGRGTANFLIEIIYSGSLSVTGNYISNGISSSTLDDTDYKSIVIQQGSQLIRLSADIMSMKFGTKVKTTETAGLSEIEDYPEVVGSSGTFSLSMYGTVVGNWLIPMSTEGLSGIIYWYPTGKIIGETYAAMRVLLDGFDEDLPFHEKVEIDISGVKQGAWIAPKGTLYKG